MNITLVPWEDLKHRFYSIVNTWFFPFYCPQAYRYLREEVKMFQGKPIMVSSVIKMHKPVIFSVRY